MNKRFLVAWLAVAVLWFAGAYVIEVYLLIDGWMPVSILRTWDEELSRYHFMVLPFVLFSGTAVWVYSNFERREPWLQRGLAYGVVLALMTAVPQRMMNYASYQLPGPIMFKDVICWSVMNVIIGVIIAWIYRAPAAAASAMATTGG